MLLDLVVKLTVVLASAQETAHFRRETAQPRLSSRAHDSLSSSKQPPQLLIAQRHHRIDPHRPPCGKETRKKGDESQPGHGSNENSGVAWFQAKEHGSSRLCSGHTQKRTED